MTLARGGQRVNIGCGRTPTPGWLNFDNSASVRFAKLTPVWRVLAALNALTPDQRSFVEFARTGRVRYADAARGIPLPDASVEALYASHMLEHLDRPEAARFLAEARRVLTRGGVLRLGVPDIARHIDRYLEDRNADRFVEATLLAADKPRSIAERLRTLVAGARHHHWMYDGASLCKLLAAHGFADPRIMPAGTTRIADPGELDLAERRGDTVYVEAVNP